MNLSPLVNNKDLWADFLQEIDERIAASHKAMEQANDTQTLFRLQGEVQALRRLKMLREKVNG